MPSTMVQARPRVVGFSDRLEYIPRPLSTISSATSSSMSTIRPSHSLTGSITSVRSGNASSPPSARKSDHQRGLSLSESGAIEPSPFDAGASPSKLFQRPSTPIRDPNTVRPSSNSTEGALSSSDGETEGQPSASNDFVPSDFSQLNDVQVTGSRYPRIGSPHDLRRIGAPRPRSSPEVKISKRQKKGKSWSALLSRRLKQHGNVEGNDVSPQDLKPPGKFAPMDEFTFDNVDLDEDNTCVIRSPGYELPKSAPANKTEMFRRSEESDEVPGAVLDLDETWAMQEAEAQANQARMAKRRLHSSGTMGGFMGSGMHHHRRAESAPALTPFSHPITPYALGKSPQMADVFEEDESEDRGSAPSQPLMPPASEAPEKPSNIGQDFQKQVTEPAPPCGDHSGYDSTIATGEQGQEADLLLHGAPGPEETLGLAVTKSPNPSTATTPVADLRRPNTSPTSYAFADTASRRTISIADSSNAEPSPDTAQTSFDAPRLGTAHSSTTERSSAWSAARTTDSGGAYHSTEDVPSLTSSASTRTGPAAPQLFSPPAAAPPAVPRALDDARSQSVSELPPRPSRPLSAGKRASLASLSRLVGGSFGEKSKLSIESRAEDEGGEAKGPEKKKRNRISRLVGLFKSKENLKG